MKYEIKELCDQIAVSLLDQKRRDEQKFLDPISIMLLSSLINVIIQLLIPYLQKKCKERYGEIINGARKPGIYMKWQMMRAIKKAKEKTTLNPAIYNLSSTDISNAIFQHIANLDEEEVSDYLTE